MKTAVLIVALMNRECLTAERRARCVREFFFLSVARSHALQLFIGKLGAGDVVSIKLSLKTLELH